MEAGEHTTASTAPPVSPMAMTMASPARPWSTLSIERGTIIGRYIVVSQLGAGGMGVVYSAYDPELDRRVALKLLLSETPGEPRQLREAQAMARLSHPNICPVYDVGTFHGRVFFAMELVDGVTLRTWLRDRSRAWGAILELFVAVGHAVAAAHAEGIVHSDLKPENIMIGADGRPRVMDFGIARTAGSSDEAAPPGPGPACGTPHYMAPELWLGQGSEPRSDQFAFCVALWEALHGERPFTGESLAELRRCIERGPPTPRRTAAPSWLRRALQRGLASAPERRFPSMAALLAALSSGQTRRRRTIAGVTAAALVLTGAGAAGQRSWERRQALAVCEAAGASITVDTWSAATRARLRASLVALGIPDADATLSRLAAWIDPFARRWQQARAAACIADDPRRVACLQEQQQQLVALLGVLSDDDRRVLPWVVAAAAALPDPAGCSERVLDTPGPRVADVKDPLRLAQLRRQLYRARYLGTTDRPAEALALAHEVIGQAPNAGDQALALEATAAAGTMAHRAGDYATAERLLLQAALAAGAAGLDEVATDAATQLIRTVGQALARHADGQALGDFAELLVRRLGQDKHLRGARLRGALAGLQRERRNLGASQALYEQSLATLRHELGGNHPEVAETIDQLGVVLKDRGQYREAIRLHEAARTLSEEVYGPGHPQVASCTMNLAIAHLELGERERAQRLLARAHGDLERALGPGHPTVARATQNIGNVLYRLGKGAEALAQYRRALALLEAGLGPGHPAVAQVLTSIGNTEQAFGDPAEAERSYHRALAIFRDALGPDHPQSVWALQGLGQLAMVKFDRPGEALELYERSMQIIDRYGLPVEQLADARARLAQAVWAVRGDRAETLRLLGLAMETYRTLGEARAPILATLEAFARDLPPR